MLAGCSSSSTTTTVSTENVNTNVVTIVKSLMTESKVGESQASWTLTGNESTDLKTVKNLVATNEIYTMMAASDIIENTDLGESTNSQGYIGTAEGKQYVVVVKKGGSSDSDMAQAIVDLMATNYQKAQDEEEYESAAERYCIKYLSVFDVEASTILADISVNGEAVTGEYWVIVATTAADAVATKTTETNNNTFVVEE